MTQRIKYQVVADPTEVELLSFIDYFKLSQDCIDVFITSLSLDIVSRKLYFNVSLKSPNLVLPDSLNGAFISGIGIQELDTDLIFFSSCLVKFLNDPQEPNVLNQVSDDYDIQTMVDSICSMHAKKIIDHQDLPKIGNVFYARDYSNKKHLAFKLVEIGVKPYNNRTIYVLEMVQASNTNEQFFQ